MKKTLLAVLAGLTVVGAASAAPTPEDRKNLCDLLIQKGTHVWVPKTQACVPVNPCAKDVSDEIRKAYCLTDLAETFNFRNGEDVMDFAERYADATKVYFGFGDYMTANSKRIGSVFPQKKLVNAERATYLVDTADRGYFAFDFQFVDEPTPLVNRKPVCLVFGREKSAGAGCNGVESEQECNDMSDYWNLLSHDQATKPVYDEQTKKCVF